MSSRLNFGLVQSCGLIRRRRELGGGGCGWMMKENYIVLFCKTERFVYCSRFLSRQHNGCKT